MAVDGSSRYYPHRKHARLPSYDYTSSGAYFVTLVTNGRRPNLAEIIGRESHLSEVGRMVRDNWSRLADLVPGLQTETMVVMPDHLHALLWLDGSTPPLPRIIQRFKSFTTHAWYRLVPSQGHAANRLWQMDYYERIVRDERELEAVRLYIETNPARWGEEWRPTGSWLDDAE